MRLTALLSLICVTCSFGVQSALADDGGGYLALGDSLAFGFNPTVPVSLNNYHGYPQFVSFSLEDNLANASCFGETSSHFLDLSKPDLGCQNWRFVQHLPLFVSYSGTQMNYAVQYLHARPKTKLVTLNLGINDLVVLLVSCQGNLQCAQLGLPGVLATYQANLVNIFRQIRGTGYAGPIVAVTNYSPTSDPVQTGAIQVLNSILAGTTAAFNGKVADAFTAFQKAAAFTGGDLCQTGLLIKLPTGGCDTHASTAGQALIAALVVNQVNNGVFAQGVNNGQERDDNE